MCCVLTSFDKPLNDPNVIDMFYQCTDKPDLLFALTINDWNSTDPTIKARFNSNAIVTITKQNLKDIAFITRHNTGQRTMRQPYTFNNRLFPSVTYTSSSRCSNPTSAPIKFLNREPMGDNKTIFGLRCNNISKIQDCLVFFIANLHEYLLQEMDPDDQCITDYYVKEIAQTARQPSAFDRNKECPVCLTPGHTFEEYEVLGNYEFLKAHMRELSLLWQQLQNMINHHLQKKAQKNKPTQLNQLATMTQDQDDSTLGENSLQGSLASLSIGDEQHFP